MVLVTTDTVTMFEYELTHQREAGVLIGVGRIVLICAEEGTRGTQSFPE